MVLREEKFSSKAKMYRRKTRNRRKKKDFFKKRCLKNFETKSLRSPSGFAGCESPGGREPQQFGPLSSKAKRSERGLTEFAWQNEFAKAHKQKL